MYSIQFWNSFWRQWTNAGASLLVTADSDDTAADDGITLAEKYDYLSQYGTHILCLLNADAGCSYLSRNFESITGLRCKDYQGEALFSLIHAEYREALEKLLAQAIPENQPMPWRCKLRHADGNWYWYNFLIHSKQGGGRGDYVCIMENVHDAILAQGILQKARLEAELALRSRSEFLSNMSHELRTPLNAIIGFSQIIESEIFGRIEHPQYQDYIRHIHESGYDLLAKIEDLLEIANIDAGRVTLAKEEVAIADIFRHVIDTQAHHAMSAQVTLTATSSPDDILLHVDRLKLQHILGHLVANAIKFSPQGTAIALDATLTPQGFRIRVRDDGTGMTGAKLNAIVAALAEDNCWSVASDNQSIGLGLALTREFVVLHGGEVSIDSKPARGTTITIELPNACVIGQMESMDSYAAVN